MPQAILCAGASDDDFVLLKDFDIIFVHRAGPMRSRSRFLNR
jgi:hypothetical protein